MTHFVINKIRQRENNKHTHATYLDLSKAFNTINHKILINKLEYYWVQGQLLDWFKCYLLIEPNMCIINVNLLIVNISDAGFVLGPLLFINYTNYLLLSHTDTKVILFADDTTLYTSSKQPDEHCLKINNKLNCLCDWFKAHTLVLNTAMELILLTIALVFPSILIRFNEKYLVDFTVEANYMERVH